MNKVLLSLIAVVLAVVIAVFLLVNNVNSIVKQGIENAAPRMLQVPVEIESVDISILSGRGELVGLKVGNPRGYKGEYVFALDRVVLELDPISLTTDTIHVKKVVIDSPAIAYEGDLKNSNIQQLQKNLEASIGPVENDKSQESKAADEESSTRLQVDYFAMTNTSALVELSFLSGDPLLVEVPDFELRDIGKNKDQSFAGVVDIILVNFNQELIAAIEKNAGGLSNQLQDKGKEMESKVKSGLNKLKSIFGN